MQDFPKSKYKILGIFNAMRNLGLQYARHITVLTPKSLVDTIKKDLNEAMGNYKGEVNYGRNL